MIAALANGDVVDVAATAVTSNALLCMYLSSLKLHRLVAQHQQLQQMLTISGTGLQSLLLSHQLLSAA